MSLFVDVSFQSLIKFEEELCGDRVEIVRLSDSTIIVMADGLGSGVKANILSTLTTKISATMLREGANIYETVDTIVNTLPVCKVRRIAYSTFTLIKIYDDGRVYLAEYDNPPIFIIRQGIMMNIDKKEIVINDRKVYESKFYVQPGDVLTVVSDGVIHAGLGNIMNLGWNWDNVCDYLERSTKDKKDAQSITKDLAEVCWELYGGMPGDDTTIVTMKIKTPECVNLFTGPPKDKSKDGQVVKDFIKSYGKKIICGGTAANILQRELNRPLNVNLDFECKDIPPTANMEGIDLITEGVITLSRVVEMIKEYKKSILSPGYYYDISGKDGASKLTRILLNECTHLTIWLGKAVNPAHQNPDLPMDLSIKLNIVNEIAQLLKGLGKQVEIKEV
ncbi:SpoIIE family protein phosphatase [Clostridium lundense]|uniref:SpoIIE family protein phosphatase n=1 Tax=Clostridium lundense TaxID=319475 RepID=UPI0004827E51|nr:SpoIIE family protein phosphatase [Clostridium lundense]